MDFKKNYLDFSGDKLIEHDIKIEDAYFLDWLKTFLLAHSSEKILIDNKVLIWVNHGKVLNDLKLVFQSKSTLIRKIESMIKKNILIKHLDKEQQKVFIGFGSKYEELLYWNESSSEEVNVQTEETKTIKPKNTDTVREEEFEWFWNIYDKKTGKDKALAKFMKLKKEDIEKIKQTLPEYIKNTPDKKFRKNPMTYLNNSCWNDEIITVTDTKEVKQAVSHIAPAPRKYF